MPEPHPVWSGIKPGGNPEYGSAPRSRNPGRVLKALGSRAMTLGHDSLLALGRTHRFHGILANLVPEVNFEDSFAFVKSELDRLEPTQVAGDVISYILSRLGDATDELPNQPADDLTAWFALHGQRMGLACAEIYYGIDQLEPEFISRVEGGRELNPRRSMSGNRPAGELQNYPDASKLHIAEKMLALTTAVIIDPTRSAGMDLLIDEATSLTNACYAKYSSQPPNA